MEKPWLQSYPPGIPAEIDRTAVPTLVAHFERAVARFGDRPAYSNLGRTLTYRELDRLSRDFAAVLQRRLGLVKGDRVAIMLPNVLQYPVVLFGALRAGMVVVNVNPLYTARELRHQLRDSGAHVIVVLANFAATLGEVLADTGVREVIVTQLGDMLTPAKRLLVNFVVRHVRKMVPPSRLPAAHDFRRLLADGRRLEYRPVQVGLDDIAFLQYTGGTTGIAKGAVLTHHNMGANLLQATAWIGGEVRENEELIVTALPLYHIFALTANCMTFLYYGAHNLLITNPRDIPGFIKSLRRVKMTAITGVNTLFNALLNDPAFATVDFSRLHLTLGGGMAVQRDVAERWQQVTGCPLLEAYGLTETCPAVAINPLQLDHYSGSIGLPIPSTEVSVRDPQGKPAPAGERGELWVRGPQVMQGYWHRPDETAQVIDDEGWLRTGDIATIDDAGYVYIVDRLKDLIDVSGFNVYPAEVEEVAAAFPGVREVAAIGVPDARSGQAVKLFVACGEGGVDAEQLLEHCRRNLTRYKVPRSIEFRSELPKSNVGKVLRRALREAQTGPDEGR